AGRAPDRAGLRPRARRGPGGGPPRLGPPALSDPECRPAHRPAPVPRVGAMDYVNLGRSGLSVSRLCLGTMNFGPQTSEEDAFAIMDRAHELGINFFDTANVYGWKKGEGVTEQIIGRWFAKGGGRREKTVIATKLYGSMGDWPNDDKLSALNIRRACDASLRRLQTDYIDIYYAQHIDRNTPCEELRAAVDVMRTLV